MNKLKKNIFLNSVTLILFAAILMSGAAWGGAYDEPDPDWEESGYQIPPMPDDKSLLPFYASAVSPNQYLIDVSSISIGKDAVVRYVLVIKSQGGARNVTFEGIRCATGEYRIYAMGRSNGQWMPTRNDEWQKVPSGDYNRFREALLGEYLCDGVAPARSRAQVIEMLKGATWLER